MGAYATISDVYRELSAQAFVSRPRIIDASAGDSLDPATGTFNLIGHGYAAGEIVRIVLVASGGSLPGGAPTAPIYVIPLDFWRFQVAATPGGVPLTFTDAGTISARSSAWGVQVDPEARLSYFLTETAALIDECLTAHATPLKPDPATGKYPTSVVGLNARMAARRAITSLQIDNQAFRAPIDRLMAQAAFDGDTDPPAQKGSLLGDWKEGKPIYPQPTDQNNEPDDAAYGNGRDAIGWTRRVM